MLATTPRSDARLAQAPRTCRTSLATAMGVVAAMMPTVVFGAGSPAPASVAPAAIEISEVMADPAAVYDSRGEWFEVHNPGSTQADLSGWIITDGRDDRHVIDHLVVPAGGYAVLARVGDRALNGGVDADHVYGNEVQLLNLADTIELLEPAGRRVDIVTWGTGFPRVSGRSMALTTPGTDNSVAASWCASTTVLPAGDLASPRAPTQCATADHALVVSEVLQNPSAVSDSLGEWFEVHNPTATDLDLLGYRVQDDGGESFVVEAPTPLPAGGYAVLGVTADQSLNGGVGVTYAYGGAMHLFNTTDTITLADPRGILVDRVSWDDGATFPDPDGASMSVIDVAADNAAGANWCTSTLPWAAGDLGTPGAATWCGPRPGTMVVVTEVMFDPETPSSERASEWFEIANVGTEPIDLAGWKVATATGTSHTISALTVAPGGRAVLAASGDPAANGGITPDYVFGVGTLPLHNDVGRVVIQGPTGAVADEVEWSAARGFPLPSGRSIELRAVSADNALGANWCAASDRFGAGDFGTPGAVGVCVPPPPPPAVVINEVMRNPFAAGDSSGEWFEVHNRGTEPVDLRNWLITDDASDRHVINRSVVVPAGGYAVLGRSTDPSRNGGVAVDYSYGSSIVLVNDTDRIALDDQHGQRVDELGWDDGGRWPRPNGASMARLAAHLPTSEPSSWCVSGPQFGAGDLGTPGSANSCVPITDHAPVVITEIHRDPAAVTDSVGEWIELYNAGDDPIDVSGWTLRDDGSDAHLVSPDQPLVIAAHDYLVLGRERSTALNGGAPVDYSYGLDVILYNSADELSVLDADLVPVDRVTWSAADAFPATAGATMSLRDTSLDNAAWSNWCSAVTPYGSLGELGTPGAPNTCTAPPVETTTTTTTTTTVPPTTTTVPPTTTTVPPTTTTVPPTTTTTLPPTTTTTVPPTTTTTVPPTTTTTVPPTTTTTVPPTTTTTTTLPPTTTTLPPTTTTTVPPQPPSNAAYSVFTIGDRACGGGLRLSGATIVLRGAVRSNADIAISGSSITVDGPISVGGTASLTHRATTGPITTEPAAQASPITYTFADFDTGGALARTVPAADYTLHVGNWRLPSKVTGVHVVLGDVTGSGKSIELDGATIVASGKISLSSALTMRPYRQGWPTLMSTAGTCSPAISLSGSAIDWRGTIVAPFGLVQAHGAKVRGGSVVAVGVQSSGSQVTFDVTR
jgi:hypothetical protein